MSGSKTIWYINKYASPPGANGGLRGLSLAREFIARGHSALVINSSANHYITKPKNNGSTFSPGFTRTEHWGVPTYTHKTLQYRSTASTRRILSWLHFEIGLLFLPVLKLPRPTHIIVSSLSLLTILNGFRLAKKFHARLIFEIRDIWPLTLTVSSSLGKDNPIVHMLRLIEEFGYRNADVVVGTMPNLSEHVHSVAGDHVVVRTIGLGVDEELARIAGSPAPPTLNKQFRVAYAGSIGQANDLHRILAVAETFDNHDGIVFEFFGKGDLLETFQGNYRHHPHIHFRGSLPRAELFQALKTADVAVLAAEKSEIWRYGQSLHKIVEYMVLGLPIIAAYSGFPSMINEANCGVFVPIDDVGAMRNQILQVKALSPSERHAIGVRGQKWILKYRTYNTLASEYLNILSEV